jgi:mRNA interferase MazF
MHDHLRTALAAPLITGNRPAPYRVQVRFRGQDGLILLDRMRALDKSRLVRRLGAVTPSTLAAVLDTLRRIFEP